MPFRIHVSLNEYEYSSADEFLNKILKKVTRQPNSIYTLKTDS